MYLVKKHFYHYTTGGEDWSYKPVYFHDTMAKLQKAWTHVHVLEMYKESRINRTDDLERS